jgi:hypothetical protein
MNFQYYIVYKTTNLINNKYYIGVHATNDLNDGYLGSGKNLKLAIKKYGKEHFQKDILYIYNTKEYTPEQASELMFIKESELVTNETLKDPLCYNAMLGGDINPNMKNTTWAIKHKIVRKIKNEQIKEFQNKGYTIGRHHTENSRWVNKNNKSKLIKEELLLQYIKEGWQPGRAYPITANTVWVTKNDKSQMVKKEELHNYLKHGYIKGRTIRHKIKVHNSKETIMINKSDLENFIKKGYKQGLHYKTVSGFKVAQQKLL